MRHSAHMFAIAMAVVVPLAGLARAGDREVAEQIAGKLQASGQLRGYDVRVKFEDGTACLRGRVATQQQMTAALALTQHTKGVERVVNGLIVRAESRRESRIAPVASSQSVDSAVAQARLVPHSRPVAPVSQVQPYPSYSHSAGEPSRKSVPGDRQVVSGDVTPAIGVSDVTFPEPGFPTRSHSVEPFRGLEFATSVEPLSATAQKASFWASTGQVHVIDLHLATTLTGFAEPMKLPDESGSSANEVFVSDEPEQPRVLAAGNGISDAIPLEDSTTPQLIQPMLQPIRRPWAGGLQEYGLPTMHTSVDISR